MNDRKHLVSAGVDKPISATKGGRNEARDRCLLLSMFRHGLRVSEACALQLGQVDIESRVMHVARLKKGLSTTHPLRADELRVIKAWLIERAKMKPTGKSFFVSERRTALSLKGAGLRSGVMGNSAGYPCPLTRRCFVVLAASPWLTRARTCSLFGII